MTRSCAHVLQRVVLCDVVRHDMTNSRKSADIRRRLRRRQYVREVCVVICAVCVRAPVARTLNSYGICALTLTDSVREHSRELLRKCFSLVTTARAVMRTHSDNDVDGFT